MREEKESDGIWFPQAGVGYGDTERPDLDAESIASEIEAYVDAVDALIESEETDE